MIDAYTASLIGVGGILIGTLVGILLQWKLRKEELNRIEIFQQNLANQNEKLQKLHHDAEVEKLQKIFETLNHKLGKIAIATDQKSSQELPK